jgi:MFS family permease
MRAAGPFLVRRRFALPPGLGVFVVCLGTLVVPFDSAVNVAFPSIIQAFDMPIPAIQWVVISYTLTYAALMLVFGRVGDMLGHRRVFLCGGALGTFAFVLCAAAPSLPWLLGARVLQGIAAALALSCGPAIATSLYPEAERTRILGVYTMVFGLGSAVGSLLAGLLVQRCGWQAVFWFRAPLSLAAFSLGWGLPSDLPSRSRERFDLLGAALLVLTIGALLLGLNRLQPGGSATPWLAAFFAAAGGFVWREMRTQHPIIDLRFFRDLDFCVLNAGNIAIALVAFSIPLLMPFYFDRAAHLPPPAVGVMLATATLGTAATALVAGRIATRVAPRRLAVLGAAATMAGQVLICLTGVAAGLIPLGLAMFLQGSGVGFFQVAYFDITTATIPRVQRGVAGSLVMMTRTVGVVTGATVLMLVFRSMRAHATAAGADDATAFLTGFQTAFWASAGLAGLVLVILLLRGRKWFSA